MLRITAGKLKNKKIEVPKQVTRPITDRIKISIFDLLNNVIENAKVLDLYAGSGAIGLEAISRGAQSARMIDSNHKVVEIIKKNIEICEVQDQAKVSKMHVLQFLKKAEETYDLIFLDPPFKELHLIDLNILENILTPESIVILRIPEKLYRKKNKSIKNSILKEIYTKKYGISQVVFYKLIQ